ncbi:MAG: DNA gyrase inhibitor YacG [Planktotalea sp.]|uniref:DNA gyrase inhibitor YacG n=1 Tax=Planktotalea sp. TaxID=2029877 RepID=UPI003C78FF87
MSCPICDRKTDATYRPFCSKRCADVDLAKWLNGGYALASTDPDDADELVEAMEQALDAQEIEPNEKLH